MTTLGSPRRGGGLTAGTAIAAIASVTQKRVMRGPAVWIAVGLAAVPVVLVTLVTNASRGGMPPDATFELEIVVMGVVSALLVAWPVGQDLEDRTAAYLWSRPLPRWTILAGKLAFVVPLVIAIFAATWTLACSTSHADVGAMPTIALCVAAVVGACVASALALAMPRHPLVLALVVLAILDPVVGAMSGGVALATVSYNARVLAGFEADADAVTSACALAAIAAVWLGVALRKLSRTEV